MDQQRRLLIFTVFSFLILFGWMNIGPKWFPGMFPAPKQVVKPDAKPEDVLAEPEKKADPDKVDMPEAVVDAKVLEHPTKTVAIGSDDPKSGYGLKVTLSTVGAGIVAAELNDLRYKALKPRKVGDAVPHLRLLGDNLTGELLPLATTPPVTGQLAIDEINKQLKKIDRDASLASVNWEIVENDVVADGDAKGISKSVTFAQSCAHSVHH